MTFLLQRQTILRGLLVIVLLLGAITTGTAHAQSGPPTTKPNSALTELSKVPDESLEQTLIGASPKSTTAPSDATPVTMHSLGFDFGRMAIALGIVIGLIFGARWVVQRFVVGARAPSANRAVKILGRTALAPRQQVLLLQVGRRVVVVGESNGQLATLAQIDDPDEIASLVGQLQEEKAPRTTSFGGLFGRLQNKSDEEDVHTARDLSEIEGGATMSSEEPSVEPANDAQAKSELSGLVDKVRAIREQLGGR